MLALIRKDGTLIGKIANKPPTQQSIFANTINPNVNVTSLGLIYSQQFDTFREFLQKITGEYRRNEKRKQAEQQNKKPKQLVNKEAILNEEKKLQKTTP